MTDDVQTPAPAPTDDELGVRMTIGEHLNELRWRLIKSVVAFAICFSAALYFQDRLMVWMTWPLRKAVEGTTIEPHFVMGGVTRPFWAYMKLCFIAGAIASSPVIIYQIWRFVAAGLYPRERRYVYRYAPISFLLFLGGCAFGFFILVRYGIKFLLEYPSQELWKPLLDMENYMSLVLILTVIMGILAQLPLVMMFVARIGLVSAAGFSSFRRWAIVLNFVLAAILTPSGDPLTQCLMAGPLVILYEVGIILARMTEHNRAAEEAAA